jgi:hypothetical protein
MIVSQDTNGLEPDDAEALSPESPDQEAAPFDVAKDDEEPEGWRTPGAWKQLLYAIKYKLCTPFLGAGASAGVLPLGRDIARSWAHEFHYPFRDADNLPRVAQFVSLMEEEGGQLLPRFRLKDEFEKVLPNFNNLDEPHRVVAELGLPLYITTNYDSFMTEALEFVGRHPKQEYCQWHTVVDPRDTQDKEVGSAIDPSPEKPVVFHLHGYLQDAVSMVLTDDDYLNFLINTSQSKVIPSYINAAFAPNRSLLFIGYSLEDMSFKVLFRKFSREIMGMSGSRHVAVQLPGSEDLSEGERNMQRKYLEEVFRSHKVRVYWGDAHKFAGNLRKRWEAF